MARARGTEVPYLTSCRVRDNDGVMEEDIIGGEYDHKSRQTQKTQGLGGSRNYNIYI